MRLLLLLLLGATARAAGPARADIVYPSDGGRVVVVSGMLDAHIRISGEFEPGVDGQVCLQEEGQARVCYARQGNGEPLAAMDQSTIRGSGGLGHLIRLGNLQAGARVSLALWLEDAQGRPLQERSSVSFVVVATASEPETAVQAWLEPAAGARVECVHDRWRVALQASGLPAAPGPGGPQACVQHVYNVTLQFSEQTHCFPLQRPTAGQREGSAKDGEFVLFLDDCRPGVHSFYGHVMDHPVGQSLTPVLSTHVLVREPSIELLHEHVSAFVEMGGSWGKGSLLDTLAATVRARHAPTVCEIGFNAGYSSATFLLANPLSSVIAFDSNENVVVGVAKQWIDDRFPGRHKLVFGDSTVEVPTYFERFPGTACDVAFVDGGHDYNTVLADLLNLQPLMAPGGVVVVDDVWADPCPAKVRGPLTALERLTEAGVMHIAQCVHDRANFCVGSYY